MFWRKKKNRKNIIKNIKEHIAFENKVNRRINIEEGIPYIVYQQEMNYILAMLDELELYN